MKLDKAGSCTLLMLMATVLTRTWAGPVMRTLRVLPNSKACHVGQLRSPSPQQLQAFQRARDAMENSLLEKDVKCISQLFPRAWDLKQLQVGERAVAFRAELALTLRVLEKVTDPALGDVLDQPLQILGHMLSQLRGCAPAEPTAEPRAHSRRLSRWLHRLQEALDRESASCLEDSVTFHLFHLLTRDLDCVASGDRCV